MSSADVLIRNREAEGNIVSVSLALWADTPDAARKLAVSTQSLESAAAGPGQGGAQPLTQRKRLLRAPTLAELDSSDSDVRGSQCWESRPSR